MVTVCSMAFLLSAAMLDPRQVSSTSLSPHDREPPGRVGDGEFPDRPPLLLPAGLQPACAGGGAEWSGAGMEYPAL